MFASVANLSDNMLRAEAKLANADELKHNRVVINLRRRLIEPVYTAWRDRFRQEKALRLKVGRRMLSRDLLRGWMQWYGMAEERRRLQRWMRRALQAGVTRAWYAWLDALADQERMAKFLRRALNASVARAWHAWVDAGEERSRMQRFLRRALNAALARAWEAWAGGAHEAQRQQSLMHKCLRRALSAAVLHAWLTLLENAEQMRRLRKGALTGARTELVPSSCRARAELVPSSCRARTRHQRLGASASLLPLASCASACARLSSCSRVSDPPVPLACATPLSAQLAGVCSAAGCSSHGARGAS